MRTLYKLTFVVAYLMIIGFILMCVLNSYAQDPRQDYHNVVPNELIVKFKADVSAEDRAKLKHQFALQDKDNLDSGSQVLIITDGTDVEKMKRLLKLDDRVERVEVNGYAHVPEDENEQFVLPGKIPSSEK